MRMIFVNKANPRYWKWTRAAKECYDIGCNCSKCNLRTIMESKCLMKETVIELVKMFGAPPEELNDN